MGSRLENCVEGCIVEISAGGTPLLAFVRGYEHPEEGFIVEPYRLGRLRLGIPILYRKTDAIAQVRMARLGCMPRPVPVVLASEILHVFEPERALRQAWRVLPGQVKRLIDGIDYEWVGLTGSWAAGLEGPGSDVDLLLYGSNTYESIVENSGRLGWTPCGAPKRVDIGVGIGRLYSLKYVELCSGAYRVTLRILRSLERSPCTTRRRPLGRFMAYVELVDIGESYLVPARYIARGPGGALMVLETWRTRYQELPPGMYWVEGEAWLEGDKTFLSPDIGGRIEPTPWRDGS